MNPRSFDRFPTARKNPGIRANGHRGKASQADSRRSRLETQEPDLIQVCTPPSECQLKQPSNTQYSYVETRNAGIHCPFLTSRNGFPGRCAINTETSAVKYLRVRRQRWSDQHSIPCVAAVFVLYMADHLTTRLICHSRARSTATSDVTLGECVQWQGCLRVLEWQNGKDFPIQYGGGRQAMHGSPKPEDMGAVLRCAPCLEASRGDGRSRGMAFTRRAISFQI